MSDSMAFRTIGNKTRLVDQVVTEIEKMIVDGQLTPDTKLPPERELGEHLGVSRTVVREAVHILVAKGLLDSRPGVGTMVRRVTTDQVVASFNLLLETDSGGISFEHLHQVRTILEVENVGLAAQQATESDIANLKQIMADMELVKTDEALFDAKDADFHRVLAHTTDNPLLAILLDSVRSLLHEYQRVIPHLFLGEKVLPYHHRILEKVAAKDVEGARQAMQEHLKQIREKHEKAFGMQQMNSKFSSRES